MRGTDYSGPNESDAELRFPLTGLGLALGPEAYLDSALPSHAIRVALKIASAGDVDAAWRAAGASRRVFESGWLDGKPFLTVDEDSQAGYRVRALNHGDHLVSRDGATVLAEFPRGSAWRQTRLIMTQVLPLLATLRGTEVFHAGGVVINGSLVGIVANAGVGKSSTIAHLIAGGASFFADDVLAVGVDDNRLVAHPGPPVLNVDASQYTSIRSQERLGVLVGQSDKIHLAPKAWTQGSQPLSALFFLEREAEFSGALVEPIQDARRLLGSAYLQYATMPDRLLRHLDIAARLSSTVPLLRLRVGRDQPAPAVAAVVGAWVAEHPAVGP